VDGEAITKGVGLLTFGLFFLWRGVDQWKLRHQDGVSAMEAAISKPRTVAPAAYTKWDRALAYVRPILMLIFGPIMIGLGAMFLFT